MLVVIIRRKKEEILGKICCSLTAFTSSILPWAASAPGCLSSVTGRMQWSSPPTKRFWRQLPDWSWRLCYPSLEHPKWRLSAPGARHLWTRITVITRLANACLCLGQAVLSDAHSLRYTEWLSPSKRQTTGLSSISSIVAEWLKSVWGIVVFRLFTWQLP